MKKALGELALIERIRSDWRATGRVKGSGASGRGLALGIGDDCAILRPPRGHEVVVTTDFSLEGRHFRRDWHSPESVGHRALARGLSDLAAMGARPLAAFLSLALPGEMIATATGRRLVDRFFVGLDSLAAEHAVPLAGGDTSESPCGLVLADIVLVGSAPIGRALRRSGGRAGQALYVSGALGGAAAELAAMADGAGKGRAQSLGAKKDGKLDSDHPQTFPQPRVALGMALLRRHLATAAIDLSDGLSTDLAHLCRESGVGAEIKAAALPVHPLALKAANPIDLALNGGEDYELLFTAAANIRMPRTVAGVPITRIGRMVPGNAITLIDAKGGKRRLAPGGWEHFSAKRS